MITGARCIERSRLMGIEARDSACSKRRSEWLRQRRGRFRKARDARRQALDMCDLVVVTARAAQKFDEISHSAMMARSRTDVKSGQYDPHSCDTGS